MKLERWGVDIRAGSCILRLVAGDIFIRLPGVGQIAWNATGFYADRLKKGDRLDPVC